MTTELKTTIGPEDVLAIDLECMKCHTRLSRSLTDFKADPQACPNCRTTWSAQDLGELRDIAYKLNSFAEVAKRNLMPFRVRFELVGESRKTAL
jgi:hypothetical protein